jgi:hypothetical protein
VRTLDPSPASLRSLHSVIAIQVLFKPYGEIKCPSRLDGSLARPIRRVPPFLGWLLVAADGDDVVA